MLETLQFSLNLHAYLNEKSKKIFWKKSKKKIQTKKEKWQYLPALVIKSIFKIYESYYLKKKKTK